MKKLHSISLFLLAIFCTAPQLAKAENCKNSRVVMANASTVEARAVCDSVEKVAAYFRAMGAEVTDPPIHFYFKQQVYLPSADPQNLIPVHAYFDTDDYSIHMTHFDSQSQTQRTAWGYKWSDALATSFLLHEIAHLYAVAYMGKNFRNLPRHWHEFFGYAVQIELMDSDLKKSLLASNATVVPFRDAANVTSLHYESDPDWYAMRAYLSVHKWGGPKFLKDLMDFKVAEAKPSPSL